MSSSTYGTYYWSELICKPNRYVLLMLEELTKAMNSIKGNWVKQYWKSSSFGEMIARHERRLQTLRQNLIVSLSGISRLCLHIYLDIVRSQLITVVGNRRRLEATAPSRNGDPDLVDVRHTFSYEPPS